MHKWYIQLAGREKRRIVISKHQTHCGELLLPWYERASGEQGSVGESEICGVGSWISQPYLPESIFLPIAHPCLAILGLAMRQKIITPSADSKPSLVFA